MAKYDVEGVNAALRNFAAGGEDKDRTTRVDEFDTAYYFVVCFQTEQARDEALARLGYEPCWFVLGEDMIVVCFQTEQARDEALARLGYEPCWFVLGEDMMREIGEQLEAKQLRWPKPRPTLTEEQAEELCASD
jgi:hypothetical protein